MGAVASTSGGGGFGGVGGSGGGALADANAASLFAAAKRGDARQLDTLLRRIPDPAQARYLLWSARDASGRTPLHVAAARGSAASVGVLLAWGADPNAPRLPPPGTAAFNITPPAGAHGRGRPDALFALGRGATPLHEAVAARRAEAVDALLAGGASPWLENAAGYTAYDLALCPEDASVVGGAAAGIGAGFGGIGASDAASDAAAAAAIARRIETSGAGASFAGYVAVRTPTSLANSWTGSADKCRWAAIVPRLEPPTGGGGGGPGTAGQQQPGLVRCELLLFRDAGGADPRARLWLDGASAYPVTSGGGGSSGLPTSALLRLHPSHEPPRRVAARQDGSGCWAVHVRPATRGPSRSSAAADFARFVEACNVRRPPPGLVAGGGAGGAAGAAGAAPSSVLAPSPWGGGGAQGQQRPAAVQPQRSRRGAGGSNSNSPADPSDALRALPGESDEAFARRLAAAAAAAEGEALGGGGGAGAAAAAARPAAASRPTRTTTTPTPAAAASASDVPVAAAHPFLPPGAAAEGAAAAAAAATATAAASPLPPAAAGATGSAAESRPATTDAEDDDDDARTCVVCLSEPRNAGLLHGSTVHRCVCRGCAAALFQAAAGSRGNRQRPACPVCRAPVERVLDIF